MKMTKPLSSPSAAPAGEPKICPSCQSPDRKMRYCSGKVTGKPHEPQDCCADSWHDKFVAGDAVPRTPEPGSAAKLQTGANELLRELNRRVFNDAIDIERLPEAVGLCEDFARQHAASVTAHKEEEIAQQKAEMLEIIEDQANVTAELRAEVERLRKAAQHLLEWVPTCSVGSSGYQRIEALKAALGEKE